jgi:hypothetical protein
MDDEFLFIFPKYIRTAIEYDSGSGANNARLTADAQREARGNKNRHRQPYGQPQ